MDHLKTEFIEKWEFRENKLFHMEVDEELGI